jgi:hypothetical protein
MTSKTIATAGVAGLLALFVCMVETTRAAEPTPVDLVDALNAVFGKPDGTRSAHNKGFCLTGKFSPAPEAATLSKAAHFCRGGAHHRALFARGRQSPGARQRQG